MQIANPCFKAVYFFALHIVPTSISVSECDEDTFLAVLVAGMGAGTTLGKEKRKSFQKYKYKETKPPSTGKECVGSYLHPQVPNRVKTRACKCIWELFIIYS